MEARQRFCCAVDRWSFVLSGLRSICLSRTQIRLTVTCCYVQYNSSVSHCLSSSIPTGTLYLIGTRSQEPEPCAVNRVRSERRDSDRACDYLHSGAADRRYLRAGSSHVAGAPAERNDSGRIPLADEEAPGGDRESGDLLGVPGHRAARNSLPRVRRRSPPPPARGTLRPIRPGPTSRRPHRHRHPPRHCTPRQLTPLRSPELNCTVYKELTILNAQRANYRTLRPTSLPGAVLWRKHQPGAKLWSRSRSRRLG